MPIVCINRPVRKNPRRWTPQAVARVAKYAHEAGHPILLILGYLAATLGLGFLICKAARAITEVSSVTHFLKEASAALASSTVLTLIIEYLKRGRIATIPLLRRVVLVIIVAMLFVQKVIDAFIKLGDAFVTLEETAGMLAAWCDYADNAAIALKGKAGETLDNFNELY